MADPVNVATAAAEEITNPYYPLFSIIEGYAANEWSVSALLGVFFGTCIAVFTSSYLVARRIQPNLTTGELWTMMWFILSGCIHTFFEGYYVTNFTTLGSKQTLLGQMWKEYALSDSRYLTSNSFVLCVETLTVLLWGPTSFLCATLILTRSPYRYPLQLIVSVGQLYGDTLYYATSFFDHAVHGISYSRPENFYFWFYFVGCNAVWIVVPAILVYQSVNKAAAAIAAVSGVESERKRR